MSAKPDGGPAFPPHSSFQGLGMTLRDYFAGQIVVRMMAVFGTDGAASRAYELADAMIAERQK